MSAIAARVIRDAGDLAGIGADWQRLWERCPDATPFQSPDWLLPWWSAFAPGELMTIAIVRGDRLIGLAPLYFEEGPRGGRLLPLGISVSDYIDVLIEPGLEAPVGQVLSLVLEQEPRWHTFELNELPPNATALRLDGIGACTVRQELSSPCPVLTLDERTNGVANALPPSKRRKLRMARHRAERRGEIAFVDADETTAESLFETLVGLHSARWRSRDQPGVLADPRVRAFHRQVVARLAPRGIARLHALRIGGETVAVYYGFEDRGRAYAYLSGFDPSFANESPGSLLLEHVIAESRRRGVGEFHFLRGGEHHKYAWGARDRFNRRREFQRVAPLCHA